MAEAKLQEALEKVAHAQAVPDGGFNDAAGEALNLCRKSFRQAVGEAPELLDSAQAPADMVLTLQFLLKVKDKKSLRKAQVKEAIGFLFQREAWITAATKDDATRSQLIEFLSNYSDMNEVTAKLEAGPKAPEKKAAAPAPEAAEDVADAADAEEVRESGDELTRRLLEAGVEGFRECNFTYPTGYGSEMASDDVLEAFSSNFYTGVSRLDTTLETAAQQGQDVPAALEGVISEIPNEDIPRILSFLVTFWEARSSYRNKVLYVVEKLVKVSPRFKDAVAKRSGGADRLPWLPAPKAAESSPGVPRRPKVGTGDKCTVVWIDGEMSSLTYVESKIDSGITLVGIHDDWRRGPSNATDRARDYLIEAIADPKEHVVAVVINSGRYHTQMLRDVQQSCFNNKRAPVFCMAYTRSGSYKEFADCGLTFINRSRDPIIKLITEEYRILKAGGHRFELGQTIAAFCPDQTWIQAAVHAVSDDQVVATFDGTTMPIPEYHWGLYVRPLSKDSALSSSVQTTTRPLASSAGASKGGGKGYA